MVEITVTDTGPGIAVDRIEDVFKPFITTKEDGLGMGLSISSSIMESFGGRLWAVSNGKKGTAFFATLPVAEETV
jgi:two-component system sensor kinase FixL